MFGARLLRTVPRTKVAIISRPFTTHKDYPNGGFEINPPWMHIAVVSVVGIYAYWHLRVYSLKNDRAIVEYKISSANAYELDKIFYANKYELNKINSNNTYELNKLKYTTIKSVDTTHEDDVEYTVVYHLDNTSVDDCTAGIDLAVVKSTDSDTVK